MGDDPQRPFGAVGGGRDGVDGRHLEGEIRTAATGEVGGEEEEVGSLRQWRQRPGEVEREVVLVGRVLDVGPLDHRVLEAEQHPRVDLEREVEVDGSLAAFLGVEVETSQFWRSE